MLPKGLKTLWHKLKVKIQRTWISSIYFDFFFLDFCLSVSHYAKKGVFVAKDHPYIGYRMEGGSVEYWVRDYSWYIRIFALLFFSIIIGAIQYKPTKKEIACSLIYTAIALKDCVDYYLSWNQGTALQDYIILFISLTLVNVYFSLKQKV